MRGTVESGPPFGYFSSPLFIRLSVFPTGESSVPLRLNVEPELLPQCLTQ